MNRTRISALTVLMVVALQVCASTMERYPLLSDKAATDTVIIDSLFFTMAEVDSIALGPDSTRFTSYESGYDDTPLGKRIGRDFTGFFERFSRIDTNYIEPQRYNYAAMLQNTNTYEVYRISNNNGYSVTFAPEWNYKIGPYFGWRWIFLGYTLDINHLDFSHDDSQRQEFDLSLYTNLFGIDLYYRKSGDNYKVRRLKLGDGVDTNPIRGAEFSGLRSSVKGFNIYYILNHHKFSYPAAFSQSTVQKRSAGSVLLGLAYTVHKVSVDWTVLQEIINERLGQSAFEMPQDSAYRGFDVKYTDISFSAGYAYNWVFAHNWLLCISLSAALAYKHSYGGGEDPTVKMKPGFSFRNFGVDGIGRFGLVYNNMKWYMGISSTLNAFNYNKSNFTMNTFFGNLNFYIGFNFGRKKT